MAEAKQSITGSLSDHLQTAKEAIFEADRCRLHLEDKIKTLEESLAKMKKIRSRSSESHDVGLDTIHLYLENDNLLVRNEVDQFIGNLKRKYGMIPEQN